MREWIIGVMNVWGYGGVVFLIALENVFPPIPSEVILTFGGFMTTCSNMSIWGVIAAATVGSLLGAIILYGAGALLGADRVMALLDGKPGRVLHFKRADVEGAMAWFDEKGAPAVFFCRCVPIVRSLISIPAGMAKMHFLPSLWPFPSKILLLPPVPVLVLASTHCFPAIWGKKNKKRSTRPLCMVFCWALCSMSSFASLDFSVYGNSI